MRNIVIAAAALLVAAAATAQAGGKPDGAMSGAEIEQWVLNHRLHDLTPSGNGVFYVDFLEGGELKGTTHKDGDRGRWWVEGDMLCRNWTVWAERRGKEERCFYFVWRKDKERLVYYNPDGTLYRAWEYMTHDPSKDE